MSARKPRCSEFIVEAIRQVRPTVSGMKPGTAAGVQLRKIFLITTAVYTEREFRAGLEELLASGKVILSAELSLWTEKDKDGNGGDYRMGGRIRIVRLSSKIDCAEKRLWWDKTGTRKIDFKKVRAGQSGQLWTGIRLCVTEDGLPPEVARLLTESPQRKNHGTLETVASKILEKLQQK
jgi:hypothetical protein